MINALIGFIYCVVVHNILNTVGLTQPHAANLLTCVSFQIPFVIHSIWLCFQQPAYSDVMDNLDFLYGYFFYDTCYLLQTDPSSLFVIHHIIALACIHILKTKDLPAPYGIYCIIIAILLEFANPIINILPLIKESSYYPTILSICHDVLFISRIVLLAYFNLLFLPYAQSTMLWIIFAIIYTASVHFLLSLRKTMLSL
jgi:hypothetical protein